MGFCGRFLGVSGVLILANFYMFICFILSCALFYETSLSSSFVFCKIGIWFNSEILFLSWGFFF
jgi:hypothetical protein